MNINQNNKFYSAVLFCLLLFGIFSCNKKKTDYPATSLKLKIEVSDNGMLLNWDEVNTSDFVRYEIFRSTSPIPEPSTKLPIDQTLKIATIAEKDKNTFKDTINAGRGYYRVQAVLKFRNLLSNEVSAKLGTMITGSFSNTIINKKISNIYFTNGNQWIVYNYKIDSILVSNRTISTGSSGSLLPISTTNENGADVVYTINTNGSTATVSEYDANTLNFIKSHASFPISWNSNVIIAKGFLYIPDNDSILIYSLGTNSKIGSVQTYNNFYLEISENENVLFSNNTSSTPNFNIYNIQSDGKLQLVGQNQDLTSTLTNVKFISPNGNYIASWNGMLFDKNINVLGLLENPGFINYIRVHFTPDEQFIVTQSSISVEVYRTNTRKLLSSFSIQSSSFSSFQTHLDANVLYILENTFNPLTGQSLISIKQRTLTF